MLLLLRARRRSCMTRSARRADALEHALQVRNASSHYRTIVRRCDCAALALSLLMTTAGPTTGKWLPTTGSAYRRRSPRQPSPPEVLDSLSYLSLSLSLSLPLSFYAMPATPHLFCEKGASSAHARVIWKHRRLA